MWVWSRPVTVSSTERHVTVSDESHSTVRSLCSEKHPLMFLFITLAFLGIFLYFLYQWNHE